MDYSQFLKMIPEATLMLILVITFIADFCSNGKERKWFNPLMCVLMLAQIIINILPQVPVSAFGGMYQTTAAAGVLKTILAVGTLIVLIQSRQWLSREDTKSREGEFYMLIVSTLLGMNIMVSSGHFLMFFLGLEMASVPMACLVALDKKRNESAESAAKFILTAVFSSGVMLYGISFIYGSVGTLYFEDVATALGNSQNMALNIMGMVFFFSGLGFKISLVPFHFWTADTYQGAPTAVTGYLSVVSKGAAAFALAMILMKVFAPMSEYWQYMLDIVVVLSITIANLFAIRQKNLKRFMAFSSISQAGYIMLAVIGNSAMGIASLSYYILVYVAANLAVFAIISVVEQNNNGKVDIDDYNGFYQTNPKLSFLMTLALFSLGGIPPFAGMFSKFFVFMAALNVKSFWVYLVVFIALVNTVVSLYYYLIIVKAMYINKNEAPLPTFKSDFNTKLALFICMAGVVLFGVCSFIYDWIAVAA
ncbi:MAG: NADH-quinone oxidoreductase subunit N [Prevotella sp.]|nr:NADH-quinone oxidoreductase subunit N [Prevotella sp.]